MYETLKYEVKDGIAYVTVCRPEALNALNTKVIGELYDAFAEFDADADAKVAILTGDGRSFVAGWAPLPTNLSSPFSERAPLYQVPLSPTINVPPIVSPRPFSNRLQVSGSGQVLPSYQ